MAGKQKVKTALMYKNLFEEVFNLGIFQRFEKSLWVIFLNNHALTIKDHSISNFTGKPHSIRNTNLKRL